MATPLEIGRRQLGKVRRSGEHALRRTTSGGRPLPDFLILGAQKAGTTSLHAHLCEHPRVASPVTKEVHYFDLSYGRGSGWYRAHFHPGAPGSLAGESTPYYLFHPLVPARVRELLPEAKLIVLLRDPVDRAFSQHNHERALTFEQLEFEAAIELEAERLAGEEERIVAEPGYRSFGHQHHSYLARGLYAEQLALGFEAFGRDCFLVLGAEDLFADPAGAIVASEEFLGLEPHVPADLSARNARSYAPIEPRLRRRLQEHFAAPNQRLFELLGREFDWD